MTSFFTSRQMILQLISHSQTLVRTSSEASLLASKNDALQTCKSMGFERFLCAIKMRVVLIFGCTVITLKVCTGRNRAQVRTKIMNICLCDCQFQSILRQFQGCRCSSFLHTCTASRGISSSTREFGSSCKY